MFLQAKRLQVAIIHCPGHQRGEDLVAKGNRMADSVAKQVAQGAMILTEKGDPPKSPEDERNAHGLQESIIF